MLLQLSQLYALKSQNWFIIMMLPEGSFPLLSDWIHCAGTWGWTCPGRESLSYKPGRQSSHKQFWSKTVRKYKTFTKHFTNRESFRVLQLCSSYARILVFPEGSRAAKRIVLKFKCNDSWEPKYRKKERETDSSMQHRLIIRFMRGMPRS